MRRTIGTAGLAIGLAAGAVGGLALGTPIVAGAEDAAATVADAPSWVADALSGLVDDGTLTEAQADAVVQALADARPERGFRPGGPGGGVVAEALGMEVTELRDARRDGATIAELAAERGVSVEEIVDAIVAEMTEHLSAAVESGRITQEQADARLATAEERATALVNGELRDGLRFGHRPGRGGMGRGWGGEGADPSSETDGTSATGTAA